MLVLPPCSPLVVVEFGMPKAAAVDDVSTPTNVAVGMRVLAAV